MILATIVLLVLFALLFITTGIQFLRKKWLRLLAGNTFNDMPENIVEKSARKSGILMIIIAIYLLYLVCFLSFDSSLVIFWLITLFVTIGSLIVLVQSLIDWTKNGY